MSQNSFYQLARMISRLRGDLELLVSNRIDSVPAEYARTYNAFLTETRLLVGADNAVARDLPSAAETGSAPASDLLVRVGQLEAALSAAIDHGPDGFPA